MSTVNVDPIRAVWRGFRERWGNGRVPVGVSENETEFAVVEKNGGEIKHNLTLQEIPSHDHGINWFWIKCYANRKCFAHCRK